jgi:hypothetical protein
MIRALMIGAISATALVPSADTFAQQKTGTADEAKVMREAGLIKSSPQKIIADGTDWRFLTELKRELKT